MLTVGQQLYYVPHDTSRCKPQFVTVTKVGRKWAELRDGNFYLGRVSIKTLLVEAWDFSLPGRCYLSKEDYERENERLDEWLTLRKRLELTWVCPDGISADDIRKAKALLFPDES
jgi:hypothetical protein